MPEMLVNAGKIPSVDELVELYDSVGWASYTEDPEALYLGVQNSLRVVTARSEEGTLIGLARVVGDGHTIAYLQDILVRPEWQRSGAGRWLLKEAFLPYQSVRQQVLLTDNDARQRAFYEALGFREIRDIENVELRAFLRSPGKSGQ